MMAKKPTCSMHEFSSRGKEIYERVVRPQLRPEDDNKFVAIDIDSGAFEVDKNDYAATQRLLASRPDAQIWLERAGQRAAYRIGGASVG